MSDNSKCPCCGSSSIARPLIGGCLECSNCGFRVPYEMLSYFSTADIIIKEAASCSFISADSVRMASAEYNKKSFFLYSLQKDKLSLEMADFVNWVVKNPMCARENIMSEAKRIHNLINTPRKDS